MPGLQAVEQYPKLMILGKPGAGKTTFLKHLAIQCVEGRFKPKLVPLFVTLKDFAEAPGQPSLLEYLVQLFVNYGVEPDTKVKKGLMTKLSNDYSTAVELFLTQGESVVTPKFRTATRESNLESIGGKHYGKQAKKLQQRV